MMKNKLLLLTIGLPGSGKSYTAEQYVPKENIFSTDDFFMKDGIYVFEGPKISKAHEWNRERTEKAMRQEKTPICVANTNMSEWERRPYRFLASKYNYDLKFLLPESPWFKETFPRLKDHTFTESDVMEFFIRNTHNVPFESIQKMMGRFEMPKESEIFNPF